jgi:PTS system cellobiose-specific IIB component
LLGEGERIVKKILLVCGAGMSTSLLAAKIEEAAKKRGLEIEVSATAGGDLSREAENIDILLLGPQLSFKKEEYLEKYGNRFPVEVIHPDDYGMMNGEKVLDFALKIIDGK